MNETTLIELACELAEIQAKEDAAQAALVARAAPAGEPVQFITGNAFMPPLRAFGRAENFYVATHDVPADFTGLTPWEAYFEAFNEACEREDIICECPDYDNALYVVDQRRFEYVDDEDRCPDDSYIGGTDADETLHDEWRLIER